jgi:hypothetical protein
MAKTAVGYPDEPSRKAIMAAKVIIFGAGAVGGYRLIRKHNPAAGAASPLVLTLLVRPLAIWLTRQGLS